MSFDTAAPLAVIQTMVAALSGVQQVYVGIPEQRDPRMTATITIAGARVYMKAAGLVAREQRYFVTFGYRMDDAEATAESVIGAAATAFLTAHLANKKLKDGTGTETCLTSDLDFGMGDRPEYQTDAATEYRTYIVTVAVTQQQTFNSIQ